MWYHLLCAGFNTCILTSSDFISWLSFVYGHSHCVASSINISPQPHPPFHPTPLRRRPFILCGPRVLYSGFDRKIRLINQNCFSVSVSSNQPVSLSSVLICGHKYCIKKKKSRSFTVIGIRTKYRTIEGQWRTRRAVCSFTAVERRIKDRTTEGEWIRTVQWNKSCVEAARLIFPDHEITFVAITRII